MTCSFSPRQLFIFLSLMPFACLIQTMKRALHLYSMDSYARDALKRRKDLFCHPCLQRIRRHVSSFSLSHPYRHHSHD